jgi:DNA-binding transcriptional regulator YhcF (GntR family)
MHRISASMTGFSPRPAYLSLSCPARAVLIELTRLYKGNNNGQLGLSVRRASERCNVARGTAQRSFVELQERGFIELATKGAFSRKSPRERMASDVPHLRQDRRVAEQGIHAVRARKTKRGIKISRRGIKPEPACGMKMRRNSLTVPSIDTVKA